MKRLILLTLSSLSIVVLSACSGQGGGHGGNPATGLQGQENQFQANDPSTPTVGLDTALVGKWAVDCQKSTMKAAPYVATIDEFRASGSVYSYMMFFADPNCMNGAVSAEYGPITKLGTYELLDTADLRPTGDLHLMNNKSFSQTAEGEPRESMFHLIISGSGAQSMQIATTAMMVKQGNQTVDDSQSRGKTKVAHRVQGI